MSELTGEAEIRVWTAGRRRSGTDAEAAPDDAFRAAPGERPPHELAVSGSRTQ